MPLEVFSHLHHVALHLGVLQGLDLLQYLLEVRDVEIRDHHGELFPIEHIVVRQIMVRRYDDWHASVVHGISQPRRIHFEPFHMQAELAAQQSFGIGSVDALRVHSDLGVVIPMLGNLCSERRIGRSCKEGQSLSATPISQ